MCACVCVHDFNPCILCVCDEAVAHDKWASHSSSASVWCVSSLIPPHSDILWKHLWGFNGRIKLFSKDYLPLELHFCVCVCMCVHLHVNKSVFPLLSCSNIFQKLQEGLSKIMKLLSKDFFPTLLSLLLTPVFATGWIFNLLHHFDLLNHSLSSFWIKPFHCLLLCLRSSSGFVVFFSASLFFLVVCN